MRYICISDIHGRMRPLSELMKTISVYRMKYGYDKTKVVFLGDYADRGPGGYDVLLTVRQYVLHHPDTICLRGNHESFILGEKNIDNLVQDDFGYPDYLLEHYNSSDGIRKIWTYGPNGGTNTYDAFKTRDKRGVRALYKWIKALPTIYRENDIIFSHAPLEYYNKNIKDYDSFEKLWNIKFNPDDNEFIDNDILNVHGHVHVMLDYDKTIPILKNLYIMNNILKGNHLNAGLFYTGFNYSLIDSYLYAVVFEFDCGVCVVKDVLDTLVFDEKTVHITGVKNRAQVY